MVTPKAVAERNKPTLEEAVVEQVTTREARAKAKPKPPRKPSAPVRNPAFREHEGLKALQRDLHRNSKK